MKVLLLLLATVHCWAAGWEAVQRIPSNQKIEVVLQDHKGARMTFVSASADALVVRDSSGERSVLRSDIRAVLVYDASRRVRNGLIWTAVGIGAGAAIGWAVCPYCANEGSGDKFVGPGIGIGAGIGALGFLSAPYRTVYKSK